MAKKKKKRTRSVWEQWFNRRTLPWVIGVPVAAGVVVFVVVAVIQGGDSGSSSPVPTPTPDPRVAGQTPVASLEVEASDRDGNESTSFFAPDTLGANAGEVGEIVVTNTGTVSHNLRIAGLDGEYETDDDFVTEPYAVKPGETGKVVFKLDAPAGYRFRCDFHPNVQVGVLTVR